MKTIDIKQIQEASKRGQLVFFVGAGMSMLAGYPSWSNLIKKYNQELPFEESKLDDKFLKIPQMYLHEFGQDKYNSILKEEFDKDYEPTDAHRILFQLNPRHIITTNYDDLLERTAHQLGRAYRRIATDADVASASENRYIMKIHGDFKEGFLGENIVLKEEDYFNFEQNRPLLSVMLKNILATNTVIFIGYSISDYNINLLINWIQKIQDQRQKLNKYYVVLADEISNIEQKYYEDKGFIVVNYCSESYLQKYCNALGTFKTELQETHSAEQREHFYIPEKIKSDQPVITTKNYLFSGNYQDIVEFIHYHQESEDNHLQYQRAYYLAVTDNFEEAFETYNKILKKLPIYLEDATEEQLLLYYFVQVNRKLAFGMIKYYAGDKARELKSSWQITMDSIEFKQVFANMPSQFQEKYREILKNHSKPEKLVNDFLIQREEIIKRQNRNRVTIEKDTKSENALCENLTFAFENFDLIILFSEYQLYIRSYFELKFANYFYYHKKSRQTYNLEDGFAQWYKHSADLSQEVFTLQDFKILSLFVSTQVFIELYEMKYNFADFQFSLNTGDSEELHNWLNQLHIDIENFDWNLRENQNFNIFIRQTAMSLYLTKYLSISDEQLLLKLISVIDILPTPTIEKLTPTLANDKKVNVIKTVVDNYTNLITPEIIEAIEVFIISVFEQSKQKQKTFAIIETELLPLINLIDVLNKYYQQDTSQRLSDYAKICTKGYPNIICLLLVFSETLLDQEAIVHIEKVFSELKLGVAEILRYGKYHLPKEKLSTLLDDVFNDKQEKIDSEQLTEIAQLQFLEMIDIEIKEQFFQDKKQLFLLNAKRDSRIKLELKWLDEWYIDYLGLKIIEKLSRDKCQNRQLLLEIKKSDLKYKEQLLLIFYEAISD